MAILQDGIDKYLAKLIPPRSTILSDMEDHAKKHGFPIVGPQVGQILMQYTKLINPQRIFELGSGYGYSAIWFAKASGPDTQIFCTDGDEKNAELALQYFQKADVDRKITFLIGDAVTEMKKIEGQFDIIYCDIDKHGYPEAFRESIPKLRRGGLMITDNTLWSGKVLEDNPTSNATIGIKEFNEMAFSDPRVLSMILPIRDGVCISLKL